MRVPSRPRPAPWRRSARVVLGVTLALAVALLAISWWQAAGALHRADQVIWTDAGVGGITLEGSGVAFWLLCGRRAVGRRMRLLLGEIPTPAGRVPSPDLPGGVEVVVRVPGMRRYHRSDCPLMAGKSAQVLAVDAAVEGRPCGVCEPDRGASIGR